VLGEIGDARALPGLELVAKNDTNMDVRNDAENAIHKIKSKKTDNLAFIFSSVSAIQVTWGQFKCLTNLMK